MASKKHPTGPVAAGTGGQCEVSPTGNNFQKTIARPGIKTQPEGTVGGDASLPIFVVAAGGGAAVKCSRSASASACNSSGAAQGPMSGCAADPDLPPLTGGSDQTNKEHPNGDNQDQGWEFDWYQATIDPHRRAIRSDEANDNDRKQLIDQTEHDVEELLRSMGTVNDTGHDGQNGYQQILEVVSAGERIALARMKNSKERPNIQASSSDAIALAAAIRRRWADGHYVSRVDVKKDVSWAGAYEELRDLAKPFAKLAHLKLVELLPNELSDQELANGTLPAGRSLYIGSKKSAVQMNMYEKGLELAAKGLIEPEAADRDAVRIEFRFRPRKRAKNLFAALCPRQMIGTCRWARDIVEVFQLDEVHPVQLPITRRPSALKSVEHAVTQYRRCIDQIGSYLLDGDLTLADLAPIEEFFDFNATEQMMTDRCSQRDAGVAALAFLAGSSWGQAWFERSERLGRPVRFDDVFDHSDQFTMQMSAVRSEYALAVRAIRKKNTEIRKIECFLSNPSRIWPSLNGYELDRLLISQRAKLQRLKDAD